MTYGAMYDDDDEFFDGFFEDELEREDYALLLDEMFYDPDWRDETAKHPEVSVKLVGTDGNTLALLSRVTHALKIHGYHEDADELTHAVFSAGSYDEALSLLCSYVSVS